MHVTNDIYDYGWWEIVPAWHSRQSVWTWARKKWTLFGSATKQRLVKPANWTDLVCVVVRSRVRELAGALQLFVVTSYMSSINPTTYPNHASSYKNMRIFNYTPWYFSIIYLSWCINYMKNIPLYGILPSLIFPVTLTTLIVFPSWISDMETKRSWHSEYESK
jgi:hypothetical protein